MSCITFSNWINAWTMRQALKPLGYDLGTTDPGYLVTKPVVAPACGDVLLFTEEASLHRYLGSNCFHFLPKQFPVQLLDNKFAFGEFARSLGVVPLPQWATPEAVPANHYPVVLKARHSWLQDIKLPRGWVCRTAGDMQCALDDMAKRKLSLEHYFIQKWLPADIDDNFSVCGFWDAENHRRNLVCVVQRIESYGEDLSSSAVVSVVPDPDNLVGRCGTILDAIAFQGPFEMEFLRCSGRFHVLELNPRFWMQHGLFFAAGNGLLKRYLRMDTERDWGRCAPDGQTWIDGMWLLRNAVTLRWSPLKDVFLHVWRRQDTLAICPGAADAFSCLLGIFFRRIKSRLATLVLQRTSIDRTT